MAHIRLRIVILFFVVVLSFWYLGVPAKIAEIKHLKTTLIQLKKPVPQKKLHTTPLVLDYRSQEEIFAALIHFIEQQGFQVETLQWRKTDMRNGVKSTSISLKILGDFSHYILLLRKLCNFSLPIVLQAFDFKESGASIECTIWHVKNTPIKNIASATLHNIPLNQLKSVGFLQSAQSTWGFLSLPNGEMHEVKVNDVIGIEKAKIIKISAHSIVVLDGALRKIL